MIEPYSYYITNLHVYWISYKIP